MLKKAGIVVATAAAGLIALTPFAFAGESHHGHHGSFSYKVDNSIDRDQYNKCSVKSSQGVSSVLGVVPLVAGVVPVPAGAVAQTATQTGNCTNVGDTSALAPATAGAGGGIVPVVPAP